MTEKMNYFAFYESFENQLDELPKDLQAKFYFAIVKYGLHGIELEFENPLERALFKQFKFAIDNQRAKSKILSDNRKKQNETNENKTEQNETNENKTEQNETNENKIKENADEEEYEYEYEKEYELEIESENEVEKEKEGVYVAPKDATVHSPPKKFKKPTLEEVTEYVKQQNYNFSPQRFIDFYESKGWLIGKSPMKDWKACCRTWQHNRINDTGQNPIRADSEINVNEYAQYFNVEEAG